MDKATAEGLVRTMYAMLKTDEQLGAPIPKSAKGWMASAEMWIKSLHEAIEAQGGSEK